MKIIHPDGSVSVGILEDMKPTDVETVEKTVEKPKKGKKK